MARFKITKVTESKRNKVDYDNLGFGVYMSDHVYVSDYADCVWNEGEIIPYGPMPIEPAMCTLHYGQTIFEGLKAYKTKDGSINLFRPEKNLQRLNNSAKRLCIPEFPEDRFLDALKELIRVEYDWIPNIKGHTLYLRPVCFGSGNFLGVHVSDKYKLIIIASPVASYYKEGMQPIRIKVADDYVRAVRGGLGNAKTAANYAASLYAGNEAKQAGYAQVLWLDGVTRSFCDEVGAMNIMFVINDEIITPSLDDGSILPGVTRDSILILARSKGYKVSERKITIDEIINAIKDGTLQEAFGTGTAAVISPVGSLTYKGTEHVINDNKIGKYSQEFYDILTGIQYGEIEDEFGWITKV
ncbi:MAG: branched-chain amino acid aminotransferase [bacterium]